MKNNLDKLVNNKYLYDYKLNDNELILSYGLYMIDYTERVIDLTNKTLKKAILESAENLRNDIEGSLVDRNDFFGYDNKKQLEERIIEETNYLKLLSSLV